MLNVCFILKTGYRKHKSAEFFALQCANINPTTKSEGIKESDVLKIRLQNFTEHKMKRSFLGSIKPDLNRPFKMLNWLYLFFCLFNFFLQNNASPLFIATVVQHRITSAKILLKRFFF